MGEPLAAGRSCVLVRALCVVIPSVSFLQKCTQATFHGGGQFRSWDYFFCLPQLGSFLLGPFIPRPLQSNRHRQRKLLKKYELNTITKSNRLKWYTWNHGLLQYNDHDVIRNAIRDVDCGSCRVPHIGQRLSQLWLDDSNSEISRGDIGVVWWLAHDHKHMSGSSFFALMRQLFINDSGVGSGWNLQMT